MQYALRLVTSACACLLLVFIGGRASGIAEVAAPRAAARAALPTTAQLDARFDATVKPFLKTYCFECHSGAKPEAELDLRRSPRWPPRSRAALAPRARDARDRGDAGRRREEAADGRRARAQAVAWFQALRRYEIARNAGDPGLVLARRLNNAEYNYTIRDLTGVDIRPTREFPADPANPAGFDNSGESLAMSPSLLKKYLAAARDVANHLYLNADGLAFAPHPMLVGRRSRQAARPPDHRLLPPARHRLRRLLRAPRGATSTAPRSAGRAPRSRRSRPRPRSARSTSPRCGACSKDRARRSARSPRCRHGGARCRRRPKGEDTPASGCEALRGYIELAARQDRAALPNLVAPGVNAAQQPFMIWRNVQYATHRMTFDPAQLQVEGEPRPAPITGAEPGNNQFGPGPTPPVVNAGGDPDLAVPPGSGPDTKRRSRASARVFPDMFYMQERGRHYFDRTQGSRPLPRRRLPQPDGLLPRRSAALRADPRRGAAEAARRAVARHGRRRLVPAACTSSSSRTRRRRAAAAAA